MLGIPPSLVLEDYSLAESGIMARILIVDDEESIRTVLAALLSREGHSVALAEDAEEALKLLREEEFDVVVADVILPRKSGLDLLRDVQEVQLQTRVILITGNPEMESAAHALSAGAFDYLAKPILRKDITGAVAAAVRTRRLLELYAELAVATKACRDDLDSEVIEQIQQLRDTGRSSDRFRRHDVLIRRLGVALGKSSSLALLYRLIHEHVRQVMDTAMFIISSYDRKAQQIRALFVVNDGEEMDADSLPPIPIATEGRGRQSQVIRTGQPLVMESQAETQGKSDTEYTITSGGEIKAGVAVGGEDVIRSAVLVPMTVDGQVIGVIQVQSYRTDAYSEEDVRLLLGMASIAAVAISNANH